jgi:hypothetical protein
LPADRQSSQPHEEGVTSWISSRCVQVAMRTVLRVVRRCALLRVAVRAKGIRRVPGQNAVADIIEIVLTERLLKP